MGVLGVKVSNAKRHFNPADDRSSRAFYGDLLLPSGKLVAVSKAALQKIFDFSPEFPYIMTVMIYGTSEKHIPGYNPQTSCSFGRNSPIQRVAVQTVAG